MNKSDGLLRYTNKHVQTIQLIKVTITWRWQGGGPTARPYTAGEHEVVTATVASPVPEPVLPREPKASPAPLASPASLPMFQIYTELSLELSPAI